MSMSASDAGPVSRLGETFFDVRGSSRSLRLTWHGTSGVAVISIWQGGTCTGTFRVAAEDLPRLVDSLRRGVPGGQANEATGPLAVDGQPPAGSAATPAEPFTGAMIALPDIPPGGGGRHMGRPTSGFPVPGGYGGYPGGPDYGAMQRYGEEQSASGPYGADPDPGAGRHAAGPGAGGQYGTSRYDAGQRYGTGEYGGQRPSPGYQDPAPGAYGYQPSPPGRPRELMPLESQSLRSLARARAARAPQQQPGPGSANPGTGPMQLADWYPQARVDQPGYPQDAAGSRAGQPSASQTAPGVPYWDAAGSGSAEQDASGAGAGYGAGASGYPAYSPPGYPANAQPPAEPGQGAYPPAGYDAYAPPAAYGTDAYGPPSQHAAEVPPAPAQGQTRDGTGGYPVQPGYPSGSAGFPSPPGPGAYPPPAFPSAAAEGYQPQPGGAANGYPPADGGSYPGQPGGYPGQYGGTAAYDAGNATPDDYRTGAGSAAFPTANGATPGYAPWNPNANGYPAGTGYALPNGNGHVNGYAAPGHEGYATGQPPARPPGDGTSAPSQFEGQQDYWEQEQGPGNWS